MTYAKELLASLQEHLEHIVVEDENGFFNLKPKCGKIETVFAGASKNFKQDHKRFSNNAECCWVIPDRKVSIFVITGEIIFQFKAPNDKIYKQLMKTGDQLQTHKGHPFLLRSNNIECVVMLCAIEKDKQNA